MLSKKFYKNFRRTIPLNHFKKKNPENSDPPSLETLLKAENMFLPSNISFFWYTFVRKMVTWVSCYRHQSTLPMVLDTFTPAFFDVWNRTEVIPSQKRHIWILEKQQNKLKSRIYDGISYELSWKSRKTLGGALPDHIPKVLYTGVTYLDLTSLWKRASKILYGIKSYS